jgi:hypothetical protein
MQDRAFISIEITAKRMRDNRHLITSMGREKEDECYLQNLSKFCRFFPFLG